MCNYWIVGAMFSGKNDMLDKFIKGGYWYCWDPHENNEIPNGIKNNFLKIKSDDRIAVKKMLGRGSPEMEVRAIGIVKNIDQEKWRVHVDWLLSDIGRNVPICGCMKALNGPYSPDVDKWISTVFYI